MYDEKARSLAVEGKQNAMVFRCSEDDVRWKRRWPGLQKILLSSNADLIGLQEVDGSREFPHAGRILRDMGCGRAETGLLRPVILRWWHLGWFAPESGFEKVHLSQNRVSGRYNLPRIRLREGTAFPEEGFGKV